MTDEFAAGSTSSGWREGALYATASSTGGFSILKLLRLDSVGVHVRLYANVFDSIPRSVDESSLELGSFDEDALGDDGPLGIGHIPVSAATFARWNPVFVQQSSVSVDELAGYRTWLDDEGAGYF